MKITIDVRTPDYEILRKTLKTEIESSPYEKTRTSLKVKDKILTIEIETDDIRALRGTFNSYMNWLLTALESLSL
jgi:tRNA threonylcarbamoyladenosine modification (KEOPS) complex  Pcc1 subunit